MAGLVVVMFLLVIPLGILLGLVKHFLGKGTMAGLDPKRPQQVHMITDEPTGPRHRFPGTAGDL